ncbi:hypothetical protein OWV82_003142 [Melia azedarach]|uniref:Uncharacterized protein n=1 Tax=Melia azedarach TaxID=155640 RepID=A0ACC1YJY3_MELAZ|nr:hypothetical protein OWV82_003142 [Melia azedarach]
MEGSMRQLRFHASATLKDMFWQGESPTAMRKFPFQSTSLSSFPVYIVEFISLKFSEAVVFQIDVEDHVWLN